MNKAMDFPAAWSDDEAVRFEEERITSRLENNELEIFSERASFACRPGKRKSSTRSMRRSTSWDTGPIRSPSVRSINLVSREMQPQADYVGSVSGASVDKSGVFDGALDHTGLKHVLFTVPGYSYLATGEVIGKCLNLEREPGMCAKLPMAADGIVRLSKIEVYPDNLEECMKYAAEVGEIPLRTEPGALSMYAVGEKENPCRMTILETYASKTGDEKHIASEHFQKYKQGRLHLVKSLVLSDQTPLNPENRINNFIQ